MKLTPKQNAVIYLLQNGWWLLTDMEVKGAWVVNKHHQFHINNGLFFRLVEMDLIYQEQEYPFNYKLTKDGEKIKTKEVTF